MPEIIQDWNNFWGSGHKNFRGEVDAHVSSDQAKVTFELLRDFKKGARVLEAGCGLGNWVFILSESGFDVFGMDISKVSLGRARENLLSHGLPSKLVLGDLRNIPLQDNSFDAIVSYGAVEHFPDTINALKDFFRILKPGGACLITTPNPYSFHRLVGRHILNITKSKRLGYVGYEDAYTPRQLMQLLEKCGFQKLRCGILPRGFGCIFGSFWWGIPGIGKKLYSFLEKIAFKMQGGQDTFGGGSFAIGYKPAYLHE